MTTPAEGTRIGLYRLGPVLGRGGMAVVHEATHVANGRTVALKLMSPDLAGEDFAERFRHEGRMQAALEHHHVVTVYEAGTSEHGPWLAMRLVRGTTLARLIDEGTLTTARALHLVAQVADALDTAHGLGLVHRDVKPRNVLVDEHDTAYLADFGLTKRTGTDGATTPGHFVGTLAYVAPEVVRGGAAGPASDRYGLAALLFECLTGTTVFPRSTHAAVVYAHTNEPPPRVSGRREGAPAALDEVLIAGLAKDPAQRPATAAELVARARAALGGRELGPPPPRAPELALADDTTATDQQALPPAPPGRRPPRRRAAAALAVTAVLAAVAGAGAAAMLDGEEVTDDAPAALRSEIPAAPAGTRLLGSDLAFAGQTTDCRGSAVGPESPACTTFQERLPEATLVVPRNGVVRRWGVRSATGELALSVLRRRDEGYFQIARSRNEFVGNDGLHLFATELEVDRGDRLGVVALDGSGIGMRATTGATTGRWSPPLRGLIDAPHPGGQGELLLRVDYEPGGRKQAPERLTGAAAAAAPTGRILARARDRYANGKPVEVRVVLIDGAGALDLLRGGRRVVRLALDDLRPPIDSEVQLGTLAEPSVPEQLGIRVRWLREGSDRMLHHYLDATGSDVVLID